MNHHTFTGWNNENRKQGYKRSLSIKKDEKFYTDVERVMKRRDLTRNKAIQVVEGWRMRELQSIEYSKGKKKRKKNKVQPR